MLLVAISVPTGISFADQSKDERAAIDAVLDDFHDAAANADADRYLGHLTDDAVFMGTDEWERWPRHPDFTDYVRSRFADGGWSYRPVERNVQVADGVAWFDEVVYSEANGRFRGTGVLVKPGDDWKIAHYALSFLIFNENWQQVIDLTNRTREEKETN
jgi:hypothetical protein